MTSLDKHAQWLHRPAHEKRMSFAEWLTQRATMPQDELAVLPHAKRARDAPRPAKRKNVGHPEKAPKVSESAIQRSILEYLAAKGIMAFRQNTGAVKTETRFFRFGMPGMADILAFPKVTVRSLKAPDFRGVIPTFEVPNPCWIEVKSAIGKQSAAQKRFQFQVEAEGHRYIVARSIEDVAAVL